VQLGKALSESLFGIGHHIEGPKQKKQLVEICQKTVDAAQKPEASNWEIAVDQWLLLAQLYADTEDIESQRLALEYAKKALDRLEEARKDGTADRREWGDTAYLVAMLSLWNQEVSQAEYWLERLEASGLSGDEEWHLIAYQVAQSHLDESKARHWLNKVTDAVYVHRNFEVAIRAAVDLAYLDLWKRDLDQALALVQKAKEWGNQSSPTQEIVEQLVRATTIEAQVAYYSDRMEECQTLLEEAVDLAKSAKLQTIADRLHLWWNFLSLSSSRFNPAGEIDKILGAKLLWGAFEADLRCAICGQKFVPEDLFENKLWICPNCDNYTHVHCLGVVDNVCPTCRTPYSATNYEEVIEI
jgi:rubrerythrin